MKMTKSAQHMILSMAIFAVLLERARALTCPTTLHCDCFEEYFSLEFHCPKQMSDITVKFTQDESVDIECNNTYFDLDILPLLDAEQVRKFTMKYCNFDKRFMEVLNRFHMNHVEKLYFEQLGTSTNHSLNVSQTLLDGLDELKLLSITFSKPEFQPNFLKKLYDLQFLHLNLNELPSVNWSFDHVPDLQQLDLSRNKINNLPDGVFSNLRKLEVLHLWVNNINRVNNDTFTGLRKLKLLELSSNQIEALPEGVFSDLIDIVNISLRANKLKFIHSSTFQNCSLLENLRLGINKLSTLENYVFSNLTSLKTIELNYNKLKNLPVDVFTNSTLLEEIKLQNNMLSDLPEKLFAGLKYLKRLYLSYNNISRLSDLLFKDLDNLKELSLENNHLKEISGVVFGKLNVLEFLDLSFNKITDIDISAFGGLSSSLINLNISHNSWNNSYSSYHSEMSPLNSCVRLERLTLHHNKLFEIPELVNLIYIKDLDLSFNEISDVAISNYVVDNELYINLTNNKIQLLDFHLAQITARINANETNTPKITTMDINDNPITCDCSNYDLIAYNNEEFPEIAKFLNIKQDRLHCANGNGMLVEHIQISEIYCPSTTNCSKQCACSYRPYDRALVVDCSYRNLTDYPEFFLDAVTTDSHYQQIVLNLTGNNLEQGPAGKEKYENVTYLDLSENIISSFTWIPPNIKELNLQKNKLKTLDGPIIEMFTKAANLNRLILNNNPWQCNCKALDFQNYIILHSHKVQTSDIMCSNTKTLLIKTPDICKTSPYLTMMLPVVLTVLLCFAVFFAIYFRYQTEIKIYLYAKNLCLWFVTEEELDKDKTYDVFISYSNEDERFVLEQLLPKLENGEHPFKVCIHIRDWMPGDLIAEQVVRSVKDSRRTLVVLSNNFLNSVWGKLEFRTAHTEAMSEGRTRVIVVLLDDVDEDKLDDELKSYLKTNTYVKANDRYFWNKLRYALPHAKHGFYERNKRIMLKIDDRFKLVVPPSPTNTSTPPIALEPSFLVGDQVKLDIPEILEGELKLLT